MPPFQRIELFLEVPWQGRTLPLSYSRSTNQIINERLWRGNLIPRSLSDPGKNSVRSPLRIIFRPHDLPVAHVNDAVTIAGGRRVMSNHEDRLPEFLVRLTQHA